MCIDDAPMFRVIDTRTGEVDITIPIHDERFDVAMLKADKWRVFRAREMNIPTSWLVLEYQEVMEYMGWKPPY